MNNNDSIIKIILSLICGAVIGWFIIWVKSVYNQRNKNEIDEIVLTGKKIEVTNASKSITQLVAESNERHGIKDSEESIEPAGSSNKKE